MPFDSLVLSGITAELRGSLLGGQVQKIYQPRDLEVHLIFRAHGKTQRLLISADARFARVCLTESSPENPPTPPQFCMALRKHLEGAHLVQVAQVEFDRILYLDFEYGDGTRKRLIVEIMGQHSNVILVDAGDVILDAIKRIPKRLSRFREVLPGKHYISPPGDRENPLEADPASLNPPSLDELTGWLQEHFQGMSGWLAGEIATRSEQSNIAQVWGEIFNKVSSSRVKPTLFLDDSGQAVDYFALHSVQFPENRQRPAASMNQAVDQVAEKLSVSMGLEQARQALVRSIATILKSTEAKLQDARKGIKESDRAEEFRILGDLLLANMHSIQKGQREAEVLNYYDPEAKMIRITLDPKLSPKENAEAYYRRQRKAKDSREELEKRIESLSEQVYDLKAARLELADIKGLDEIESLRQKLTEQGLIPKPQALPERAPKGGPLPRFRRITTPEGWEVLVGESAEANDYLTTKLASPADLWFHARSVTGAHVILRTGGKQLGLIPPAVIKEAARLAALGSEARHSAIVPVDYTQKRYVRKPRGSAPGNVLYVNEKTMHVELK